MRQAAGVEPEREEESAGEERTVHVLSEARRRAGVLQPRRPGKAQVPAARVWGKAYHGAHKLLGEVNASINLVAGEDYESDEDEEWWVNTVRIEGEGEDPEKLEDLGLEGSEGEADNYCLSACMRRDDSGLEDELEYFWDAPLPPEADESGEDRWWSPGPQGPSSEEEDEEEVRYLVSLPMSEPKEGGNREEMAPSQGGTEAGPGSTDHQVPVEGPDRRGEGPPGDTRDEEPPATKKLRRRRLRRKRTASRDKEWEAARRDAWLRELLGG
jgi:hypothetical protein